MAAGYEKTRYPGIYRRGGRYVVKQRDGEGRMVSRSAATVGEARAIQAELRETQSEGQPVARPTTFAAFADEWITTYAGRTGRGFRETTREGYRAMVDNHAKPFFGKMQLAQIQPRDVKAFAAALTAKGLSPASVSRYMAPVKAMLATAFEDGVIRVNPATNVRTAMPRERSEDERAKAMSDSQLALLLDLVDPDWRPFMEFMALTGMRIGEAIAVRWQDVDLASRVVRVRRACYLGVMDEPKSKYGKRSIPLTPRLAAILERLREQSRGAAADATVFTTEDGTMVDPANFRNRVMRPAAAEAGLEWVTPHTLRHTFASRCFRHGCNVKQVQALLGHHSPAFTLETYVHLLPEDLPDLAFLD
jgi:integrase